MKKGKITVIQDEESQGQKKEEKEKKIVKKDKSKIKKARIEGESQSTRKILDDSNQNDKMVEENGV